MRFNRQWTTPSIHDVQPAAMRLRRAALLVPAALLLTPLVFAQYNASIQGTVADASGAVVPGATVTLKDNETNKVLTQPATEPAFTTSTRCRPAPSPSPSRAKGFATDNVHQCPDRSGAGKRVKYHA